MYLQLLLKNQLQFSLILLFFPTVDNLKSLILKTLLAGGSLFKIIIHFTTKLEFVYK
jgi:hypothetical protein